MTVFVPAWWISQSIITLIYTIANSLILHHEIKKRRDSTIRFTTNSLKYTSLSCIIFCLMANTLLLITYFNVFCLFAAYLAFVCMSLETLAMGFYQLSRLYYCFSNSKIHSKNGYPKWIFIFMIVWGILIPNNI